MSRIRALALGLAVLLSLVAVAGLWVEAQINPSTHPGRVVDVSIPAGSSTDSIAGLLAADRVISSSFWFRVYLRLHDGRHFDAGVYALREDESYPAVVKALHGPEVSRPLVIPEGFTISQIAQRVGALPGHSAAHFLAVAAGGTVRSPYEPAGSSNLEGLLFPDTYTITPGESDTAILEQMISRFDQVASDIGLSRAPSSVGVSPYQAVIVASLIEREAKLAGDRPLVGEVIYNRLAKGMRLQIDATVLYALGPGHSSLSAADLQVPSPYNTYLVAGLPPGPIADPGQAALEAALHPSTGNYLYYVVVGRDGTEAFSTTLAGQDANIALARSRGLAG
ncbi:MAG: endolytic transglycosylase MltG [Acidimicrobiales bacterium]